MFLFLNKQVEATLSLPVHDAVISESTPIADTVAASSNKTLVNILNLQEVVFYNLPLPGKFNYTFFLGGKRGGG